MNASGCSGRSTARTGPGHAARALGVQRRDARVLRVGRAVDVARLALEVALEDLLDVDHAEQAPVAVAQREAVALGRLRVARERDRDAPRQAVGEPHLVHHAPPVVGALEAAQRAEAADREQLEVGRLPRR